MSLVWHGYWPGYFITFFGGAVMDILQKNLVKTALMHKITQTVPVPVLYFFGVIFNRFMASFFATPFYF